MKIGMTFFKENKKFFQLLGNFIFLLAFKFINILLEKLKLVNEKNNRNLLFKYIP